MGTGPKTNLTPCPSRLGNVPLRLVGAFAEKVLAHLLLEVLPRPWVGEVQAVLVHEHLLVLEPALPRLLRDAFPEPLAELAGIRRKVEALGLAPELDALHHARHESPRLAMPSRLHSRAYSSFTNTFERRSGL